ncbi:hypothetical protein OG864_49300 [Streptomyces sp. NBC_00124]|uniref:hypothetical protein n=1 Tax=Streptomyces sp. NBC_00124 TaxID=2975662 RepID=UPI002252702D|nr:hypothetical protein [Streptomyces sp. NBC_00124]MCX5366693.1 hypothetical protein [Streptomyces sp. NBC_00124]
MALLAQRVARRLNPHEPVALSHDGLDAAGAARSATDVPLHARKVCEAMNMEIETEQGFFTQPRP